MLRGLQLSDRKYSLIYFRLGYQVNLVLDEDHGDVPALVLHLLPPLPDGQQRVPVRGGEGDDTSLGPAVVSLGDGVELLLPGGVPQHQSHVLPVGPQLLLQEVHPDGFLVTLGECSPAVPLDHARLPNGSIADYQDLVGWNRIHHQLAGGFSDYKLSISNHNMFHAFKKVS